MLRFLGFVWLCQRFPVVRWFVVSFLAWCGIALGVLVLREWLLFRP